MGKLRSRQGCLTCRKRHVKCDETKPKCGQCAKSDRPCETDPRTQQLQVRRYKVNQTKGFELVSEPELSQPISPASTEDHSNTQSVGGGPSRHGVFEMSGPPQPDPCYQAPMATTSPTTLSAKGTSTRSIVVSPATVTTYQQLDGSSRLHQSDTYSPNPGCPVDFTHGDGLFVHHFAQHLAAWLDCTDASRHFTLNIAVLAKQSPILLNAVVSFAARHMKCDEAADGAQQQCVELLIPHLSRDEVGSDEAVLCAIVILRVCEQLSATSTGSDQERHLSGLCALMKASQAPFELDPASPTLSQAAFWVYVRQVLYNACVNQQMPNLDFGLIVLPPPTTPGINVQTETAWANTMSWICALVIRFCFGDSHFLPATEAREQRWLEMSEMVQDWEKSRPSTFDPIWYGEPEPLGDNPFPEILFTSDWHLMAFGFYHLACMLLAIYQAAPRFAIRRVSAGAQDTDSKVMMHARALCGATKSSLRTVPSLITLCHSTFIWGPLMTDPRERNCVLKMLEDFEQAHCWPTAWIVTALKKEWYTS